MSVTPAGRSQVQNQGFFARNFAKLKGFFRGRSTKQEAATPPSENIAYGPTRNPGPKAPIKQRQAVHVSAQDAQNIQAKTKRSAVTLKPDAFADKLTKAEKQYLATTKDAKGLEKLSDLSEGRKNFIQLWRKEKDFTKKARKKIGVHESKHQNHGYYKRNAPGGTRQFEGYPQRENIYSDEKVSGNITLEDNPKGKLYHAASTDALTPNEEEILKQLQTEYTPNTKYSELPEHTQQFVDAIRNDTLSTSENELISAMKIEITNADRYEVE